MRLDPGPILFDLILVGVGGFNEPVEIVVADSVCQKQLICSFKTGVRRKELQVETNHGVVICLPVNEYPVEMLMKCDMTNVIIRFLCARADCQNRGVCS